jgi:hypothetical protein
MRSERSQILDLLAARRIDVAQAERLLILVGGRDRFLTFALASIVALAVVSADFSHGYLLSRLFADVHSATESVTASEAYHHVHLFLYRLLGELP